MGAMSMAEYQALPALSAGGAWLLSEACPALYWAQSPFNPAALPRKNQKEFDIGTAAHLAVLEPDLYRDRVCHVPFDSYKKVEAREIRDAAYAAGQTPLKPSEVVIVDGVRDAIQRQPDVARLFTGGFAEQSYQWEIDGVPAKCRPDYHFPGYQVNDLKTVACADRLAVAFAAKREGWFLRVPWYLEGVRAYGTRTYFFVCVEKTPPYLIEVYELDERALAWGQQIMRRALRLFKLCRENNHWPGYDGRIPIKLELPSFAEYQLADREQAGDFEDDAIARGNRFLRP